MEVGGEAEVKEASPGSKAGGVESPLEAVDSSTVDTLGDCIDCQPAIYSLRNQTAGRDRDCLVGWAPKRNSLPVYLANNSPNPRT